MRINAGTQRAYRGINLALLMREAMARGDNAQRVPELAPGRGVRCGQVRGGEHIGYGGNASPGGFALLARDSANRQSP